MARFGVSAGQTVYDADGKRLGKVTRCDAWGFEVRRGLFSPRSWVVRYDEILALGADSVRIARSDADLFELAAGELPHSWRPVDGAKDEGRVPSSPAERGFADTLARSSSAIPPDRD